MDQNYLPQFYSYVPTHSPIKIEIIPIIEYKVKLDFCSLFSFILWAGGTKVDYKSMHNF